MPNISEAVDKLRSLSTTSQHSECSRVLPSSRVRSREILVEQALAGTIPATLIKECAVVLADISGFTISGKLAKNNPNEGSSF